MLKPSLTWLYAVSQLCDIALNHMLLNDNTDSINQEWDVVELGEIAST